MCSTNVWGRFSNMICFNRVRVVGVHEDFLTICDGEKLDIGSAAGFPPDEAHWVKAILWNDNVKQRVCCTSVAVELATDNAQYILGIRSEGEAETVVTVDTELVESTLEFQMCENLRHDSITTVSPTWNLRDQRLITKAASLTAFVLIPVDNTFNFNWGYGPTLPSVWVGFIKIGAGIVVIVKIVWIKDSPR